MSEKLKSTPVQEYLQDEAHELPSDVELVDAFADKKAQLESDIETQESKPGFKMDAMEIRERNKSINESKQAISDLDDEWVRLGGADIDSAQAAIDKLNFKSTAEDHVAAKTALRDARKSFYDNFKSEYEKSMDADEEYSESESESGEQAEEANEKAERQKQDEKFDEKHEIYTDYSPSDLVLKGQEAYSNGDKGTLLEVYYKINQQVKEQIQAGNITQEEGNVMNWNTLALISGRSIKDLQSDPKHALDPKEVASKSKDADKREKPDTADGSTGEASTDMPSKEDEEGFSSAEDSMDKEVVPSAEDVAGFKDSMDDLESEKNPKTRIARKLGRFVFRKLREKGEDISDDRKIRKDVKRAMSKVDKPSLKSRILFTKEAQDYARKKYKTRGEYRSAYAAERREERAE